MDLPKKWGMSVHQEKKEKFKKKRVTKNVVGI